MTSSNRKLLVVQCAALGKNLMEAAGVNRLAGLTAQPLTAPSPGVTCTAQAGFRTGATAAQHGMVANGLYHRLLRRPLFWEQSASQVAGPRIWDEFRKQGGTVGMMFWQQSLGEDVDLIVSPRPIHKHSGGMIQDCHTKPSNLYDRICKKVGKSFNLMHYWGPLASRKSSEWIVAATKAVLEMDDVRPDVLLTYLPHLDYDAQRFGISHPKANAALEALRSYLQQLADAASAQGYELLIWGDYAMHDVTGAAVFPNQALRQAGLLQARHIKGMAYPDLFGARAFAVVDHEITHVYVPNEEDVGTAVTVLSGLDGVAKAGRRADFPALDHPHSGEVIAFTEPGRWFAYPWWNEREKGPDFATHVDIHNKPGFDPCELFFGRFPWQVSLDTTKVGGTHGNGGQTVWASSLNELIPPENAPCLGLEQLATAIQSWLTSS